MLRILGSTTGNFTSTLARVWKWLFLLSYLENQFRIFRKRKKDAAYFSPFRIWRTARRNEGSLDVPANSNTIFNHPIYWYLGSFKEWTLPNTSVHCSERQRPFLLYLRFLSQKRVDATPERLGCLASLPRLHYSRCCHFGGGSVKRQLRTFHNCAALGHGQGQIHQI